MKYRKKPVVIEAVQWLPPVRVGEVYRALVDEISRGVVERDEDRLRIRTLEGVMTADPGDWIIRGVQGEVYPCKPDIFEATYERAI